MASDVRIIQADLDEPVHFLAFAGGRPVGIATSFMGFSTLAARPLVNIHDLHVVTGQRRCGIGSALLEAVEERAGEIGCCKLTLEVQEKNHIALARWRVIGRTRSRQMTRRSAPGAPRPRSLYAADCTHDDV